MIKSAVRSLFDDFQKSLFYWLTFVVTTLFMFVFFQIACSPMIGMKFIEGKNDLVAYLSVLVITVCLIAVFFANDFYVKKKAKDLAVRLVCGSSFIQLTIYLLSQTFILFLMALPVAGALSIFVLWFISFLTPVSIEFVSEGFLVTVIMLIFEIFWCTILNIGYAYRSSIVMLIQGDRMQKSHKSLLPFHLGVNMKKGIGLVLFIVPIIFMYIYGKEASSFLLFSIIGMIGLKQCFHKLFIPSMDDLIKKHIHHHHKITYLGFLRRDMIFMENQIIFLIVGAILLLGLLIIGLGNAMYQILIYVSFVAMNCLLSLTIMFRFSTEMIERQKLFLTLQRIGYEHNDLFKIIKKEVFILYSLIVGLALFYMVNIFISLYIHFHISVDMILLMLSGLCGPLIICGTMNYFNYKKQMNL